MTIEPKRAAGRPRKQDAVLDKERIVDAAWALVERGGVEGLTTRTLAAALGVKSPALYWHVPGMSALHSLMVERMLTESIRRNGSMMSARPSAAISCHTVTVAGYWR